MNKQNRTYRNVAEAVADESSSIGRFVRQHRASKAEQHRVIASWTERGYSVEEAWAMALYGRLPQD